MNGVVTASVDLPGISVERAFSVLVDPAAQERWMIATRLYPLQAAARVPDVGSRLAAFTGIGGIGFLDTMTVTAYEPPHRWVMDKDGRLLRGVGTMAVAPTPSGSRATWTNELSLPFGPIGRLGFLIVRPAVELALAACLRRLARMLHAGTPPAAHRSADDLRKARG